MESLQFILHQPTEQAAKRLLGSELIWQTGKINYRGLITETEAYLGPEDLGCHSSRSRTPRTEPMYGPAGTIYVYFIYGMYHCLNIVTQDNDRPEAILLRGLQLIEPENKYLNGPGIICRELKLTCELSGQSLGVASGLDIVVKAPLKNALIDASPRVGVNCLEPWRSAELRYRLSS